MDKKQTKIGALLSILLAFFAMGFVDMVGTATNYAKADFGLSDTVANFLPTMVFFWFLIMSVPTSMLMNKIGKRKTVVVSLVITAFSLLLPTLALVIPSLYTFPVMLVSFCLVGIGNAIMQVSLNPLVALITDDSKLASTLTFGQFVKAIASFIAPILFSMFAAKCGNWMILFPIFMVISMLATFFLFSQKVDEPEDEQKKATTFGQCLGLLGSGTILMLFFGIVSHVGIDVGVNTCAPKLMQEIGIDLNAAAKATSVYFLFRTIGCFSGTFILRKFKDSKFFAISVVLMVLSMAGLFIFKSKIGIYAALALVGFGNSNIFPIIFSKALLARPDKQNEVSGLMIMGLIGGSIFPLFMGILSDALASQIGSVIVVSVGVVYLIFLAASFNKQK